MSKLLRILLVLTCAFAWSSWGDVVCSGTSASCTSSGGGVSSPVATDPLTFTGVVTFNNAANTPLTCSDGLISPSLAAPTGSAEAISSTAPAATTGASQAGKDVTITASDAVASTDTAGAAKGGAVVLTGKDAKRNTSGNAEGGNVDLVFGAGIGTGLGGMLTLGGTTSSFPALYPRPATTIISVLKADKSAYGSLDAATLGAQTGAVHLNRLDTVGAGTAALYSFSGSVVSVVDGTLATLKPLVSSVTAYGSSADAGVTRVAAGVVGPSDGTATANGWIQNSAGDSRVAGDFTNNTATFAAITGITSTLKASRHYTGVLVIKAVDSTAGEGIKLDFNGGAATMTDFWAACSVPVGGTTVIGTAISTSLAGVINFSTITGESIVRCDISLTVNAAGTFIPRQAQDSHATGTLTIRRGSYLALRDTP